MIDSVELLAAALVGTLTAYALLGGADYGGGLWDLLASGRTADRQRATIAHAIGPVWEANHVWLIVAIVMLFTGFPRAFAAVSTFLLRRGQARPGGAVAQRGEVTQSSHAPADPRLE